MTDKPIQAERIAARKAPYKGYVVALSVGKDIRRAGVRARFYLHIVGPKKTEFDAWVAGFRLFSLFVFLHRYSREQMRFTVEWRGRTRFVCAWRWLKAHRRIFEDTT